MYWSLERIQANFETGLTTSVDLFDKIGVLLLHKGQLVTKGIRDLLQKREVYVWKGPENSYQAEKVKSFSKDVYIKLVGSLWDIYHKAKLIQPEQIKSTVPLVETIINELKPINVYLNLNTVRLDVETFKHHDYGTFVHSLNVAILATLTGMRLGYIDRRLKYLTLGALLHDIGKLKVPKEILNKPGSLTGREFEVMKLHPLFGMEMLKYTRLLPGVLATIEKHHERWNGTGYPNGSRGNNIHLDAQIVAVSDVYEALTADRPYRKGLPPYHALEMILAWSGKDFNPLVVQAFRESLILYPENAIVTLNTREMGVIAAVPLKMPTRPLIRLLIDNNGRLLNKEIYVDLMQDLTRFIDRVEFKEVG
ncbi:HD-GYP domain-containing protein [Desulfosporosinus sp. Sb-LF]|uniref:HD-GYP domain-containing protein n=1 Tax=Desulfosporosinus sp. Sb-LF TaxID=2560027 RepID=UPI00107EF0C7|nr:HD-GYP domain-containing protein [Desulfosporosinus sp. Sb-LF]TGE34507.1 HD-GYP domain-containing protein [Desulfosporosinus sp. Sb-LF]